MNYATHPHQRITQQQYQQLLEDNFLILPGFIPADELPALQAAQRRALQSWDEVKDNPPPHRAVIIPYPYTDLRMSQLYLHPELIRLGRRFLKTPDVHARVGCLLARYPGFVCNDPGHIDNGNNSLLPMSTTAREFGQLGFWIHLEEVKAENAPLRLVRTRDGKDLSKAVPLVCPPGTVCVFNNYTFHAASDFTGPNGQRFTWGWGLGRADHVFEGFVHYTNIGTDPMFKAVIASFTADERTLFRFPPPNHPYYTRQTLAALEAWYPGWNARGEYLPSDG